MAATDLANALLAAVLALTASAGFAQAATPAPPPPACAAAEHRQFDFWVGRWDVYRTGDTTLRARSHVEKLYGGCTIRENWMPLRGGGGGSLNMYDPADRRWHQTWHDSMNSRVEFDGGLVQGKMVLIGYWRGVLARATPGCASNGAEMRTGRCDSAGSNRPTMA